MSDLFGPEATAKSVHATLDAAYAAIPDGKTHALLFDATTEGTVRGFFVQRVGGGWQVVLEGDVDHAHGVSGKATIAKAW